MNMEIRYLKHFYLEFTERDLKDLQHEGAQTRRLAESGGDLDITLVYIPAIRKCGCCGEKYIPLDPCSCAYEMPPCTGACYAWRFTPPTPVKDPLLRYVKANA